FSREVPTGLVEGVCEPEWAGVADAFVENFTARGEVGASVCVTVDGRPVVDLWGGKADLKREIPWNRDTVGVVYSCTKGAVALIAGMLAERGVLDLDAPVTELWPEYGAHGKEYTTPRMMLDHTAGVPAFREPVPEGGFADWEQMTARIAAEPPFFEPGTRSAYHAYNFAWTIGEVIRRATGKTAGQLLAEEIAGPLGLDFWLGTPEEVEPRVARLLPAKRNPGGMLGRAALAIVEDNQSIPALFYFHNGGFNANRREYKAAEIGSANGVTNARSLARMYAALANGGELDGVRLVRPETIAAMRRITNATHCDATLRTPLRFGAGFMRSCDRRHLKDPPDDSMLLGAHAFGHSGAGGSIGFADPQPRMSFAYTMNRMAADQELNARRNAVVDAAYRALGYTSTASGAWTR
ncbi:MAG: serine hydrolase domain-containing protein, partial [Alphaproteobacteria bacterium]